MKTIASILLFFCCALLPELNPDLQVPAGHTCNFKLCPMKGQIKFAGCGACEEGSDCWCLDEIHWQYPAMTYDQCDSILFSPMLK